MGEEIKQILELKDGRAAELIHQPQKTKILLEQLCLLWEASVRKTHLFLEEEDIKRLRPIVMEGLAVVDLSLIQTIEQREVLAFMGVYDRKIEMLFALPEAFNLGLGSTLVRYAIEQLRVSYVDVNEDNPRAYAFYQHMGFEVIERQELDEQGAPFPILKMQLKA